MLGALALPGLEDPMGESSTSVVSSDPEGCRWFTLKFSLSCQCSLIQALPCTLGLKPSTGIRNWLGADPVVSWG